MLQSVGTCGWEREPAHINHFGWRCPRQVRLPPDTRRESGLRGTSVRARPGKSLYDYKTSAVAQQTDSRRRSRLVSNVPCVDGSELARTFCTTRVWSEQPCVLPVDAVHMTAGHNALRGSGPGQKPAFEMLWHMWVVLITGSTGSALRAVGPFQPFHHADDRRDSIHAASATGSL